MIPSFSIFIWLLFLNLAVVGLYYWTGKSLPKSPLRRTFRLFLFGYLSWMNPLLLIQLVERPSSALEILAKCILAGGCFFVGSLGYFTIQFAAPGELKSIRFKFAVANFAFLAVASLLGYVESGVRVFQNGIAPIPGPLQGYFNVSMVLFGIYFITVASLSYRTSEDPLLKLQLRTILWTCSPAFILGLFTNAIIPGLTGNFTLTPTGGLWLLLFFGGICYILFSGKVLLVYEQLEKTLGNPEFGTAENIFSLQKLFCQLRYRLESPEHRSKSRFEFTSADGERMLLEVEQNTNVLPESTKSELLAPSGELDQLAIKNTQLSALVVKAEQKLKNLGEQAIDGGKSPALLSGIATRKRDFSIVDLRRSLEANKTESRARFGVDTFAFSKARRDLLLRISTMVSTSSTFFLVAETGAGKKTLARTIEESLSGEDIEYFSDVTAFPENTKSVRSVLEQGRLRSALLAHVDMLAAEDMSLLLDCYKIQTSGQTRLYLTASPGVFELAENSPFDILRMFEQNCLLVPSIRQCPEDLPYFLVEILGHLESALKKNFSYISRELLDAAMAYSWPGNLHEMQAALLDWVLSSDGGKLESASFPASGDAIDANGSSITQIFTPTHRGSI